jgi:hypothetical protein
MSDPGFAGFPAELQVSVLVRLFQDGGRRA